MAYPEEDQFLIPLSIVDLALEGLWLFMISGLSELSERVLNAKIIVLDISIGNMWSNAMA